MISLRPNGVSYASFAVLMEQSLVAVQVKKGAYWPSINIKTERLKL